MRLNCRHTWQQDPLRLQPMQTEHQSLFVALYCNPLVMAHTGIYCDRDTADSWFSYALAPRPDTRVFYWVLQQATTGCDVGLVALQKRPASSAELGILLLPAYWRQGYGRQALARLTEHCFAGDLADTLWLRHVPANAAMARLAQCSGFVLQHQDDFQHWCLAKADWLSQPQK